MRIDKLKFGLITALLLGSILRLWHLNSIPPSLTPDEAALGYNAYSILKTGRDEYGELLPVIFKSFGDYKPGLYIYADVPFVALFGLNESAVRLPSAIAGIFIIYLGFLIARILFNDRVALITAFCIALNPWLIHFSRGAWEANLSLAFTLLGILAYFKSLKNPKFLLLSVIAFAFTLLTYQGAKLSTLIVVTVLVLANPGKFKNLVQRNTRIIFMACVVGVLISLPILLSFFRGQTTRLEVFSIFSYPRPETELTAFLEQGNETTNSVSYAIFHSEPVNFVRAIAGRLFNAFSGEFLFFEGDYENPLHSSPYQGMLLLADILFLPIGVLAASKLSRKDSTLFLLIWLILSALPAALSRDRVSAVRSLNLAIPLTMVLSLGINEFYDWIKDKRKFLIIAPIFLYLFAFLYFLDAYFVHLPNHNSKIWRYGYKEAFQEIINGVNDSDIVFEQSYNQPYIYYLFYSMYDPARYQEEAKLIPGEYSFDVGFVEKVGGIDFQKIDWQVLKNKKSIVVIGSPDSFPPGFEKDADIIKKIDYPGKGGTAFYFLKIK